MIMNGDDPKYIAFVKARLSEQFLMSNLGPLRYFLQIKVSSTSGGYIFLVVVYTWLSVGPGLPKPDAKNLGLARPSGLKIRPEPGP